MYTTLFSTQLVNPALGDLGNTDPVVFTGNLLSTAISVLFVAGVVIALFMLLTGGILWITSAGDKGKYETAKSRITQAIIGLFVLLLVFAIINLFGCLLGVNLLQFEIGEMNVGFAGSPVCNTPAGSPQTPPSNSTPTRIPVL